MKTLLDKNSKDSTAFKHVMDPESVENMATKRQKSSHTHFVLKRHSPTSSLIVLDQTETGGHLKQIGMDWDR